MAVDKGLLGGSTVLMLLSLLQEQDCYGYEIIRKLEERSESVFQFKEGTLYPVLHRMESQGWIESYTAEAENGKKRKYYRITVQGKKQLVEERERWEEFSYSVNRVIGGVGHAFG